MEEETKEELGFGCAVVTLFTLFIGLIAGVIMICLNCAGII